MCSIAPLQTDAFSSVYSICLVYLLGYREKYRFTLIYYHQRTTLIQRKIQVYSQNLGTGSIIQADTWTEQVMRVLLQLMKQMLEENTGSGILQRGWDFRQMLEIAPGHQGDLCYWLSPRFGPSQSTQRRYFKNVWHSWKMITVMPGKTTSPTDQFPDSFICLFRLECPTFTRQDVRV